MAKPTTLQIKLVSSAGTGHFYVTKKNPRTLTEKMEKMKYDPRVRKHVLYKEQKITKIKPKLSTTGGTSDLRFIKDISPGLEFGLVGKTMHRVDEVVSLKDLKNLSKIYQNILQNYFK